MYCLCELRERDNRNAWVLGDHVPNVLHAYGVGTRSVSMQRFERHQRIKVAFQDVEHSTAFGFLISEQFRKRELDLVVTHKPAAEFCVRGVPSREERVSECFAAQQATAYGVGQRRVT